MRSTNIDRRYYLHENLVIHTISIVIPAYNEEAVIPFLCRVLISVIDQITTYKFEIIIVENGSTDTSLDILLRERRKDRRIKIVKLVRNVGLDIGIIAGLTYARGDAAIVMNADLQDEPKLISRFLKKWEAGYDMVFAIIRSRKGVSQAQQFFVRVLYKGLHLLTIGKVPENVSDYRLLDRSLYSQILMRRHRFISFRVAAAMMSNNAIGIGYDRPQRQGGSSKMTISDYLSDVGNAIITIIMYGMPPISILNSIGNQPLYTVKHTYGLRGNV